MKKIVAGMVGLALLIALGVGVVWAIWDWKNTLQHFAIALLFSFGFATALLLPAFVVYLIRERNFVSACRKSFEFWAHVCSQVLGQI